MRRADVEKTVERERRIAFRGLVGVSVLVTTVLLVVTLTGWSGSLEMGLRERRIVRRTTRWFGGLEFGKLPAGAAVYAFDDPPPLADVVRLQDEVEVVDLGPDDRMRWVYYMQPDSLVRMTLSVSGPVFVYALYSSEYYAWTRTPSRHYIRRYYVSDSVPAAREIEFRVFDAATYVFVVVPDGPAAVGGSVAFDIDMVTYVLDGALDVCTSGKCKFDTSYLSNDCFVVVLEGGDGARPAAGTEDEDGPRDVLVNEPTEIQFDHLPRTAYFVGVYGVLAGSVVVAFMTLHLVCLAHARRRRERWWTCGPKYPNEVAANASVQGDEYGPAYTINGAEEGDDEEYLFDPTQIRPKAPNRHSGGLESAPLLSTFPPPAGSPLPPQGAQTTPVSGGGGGGGMGGGGAGSGSAGAGRMRSPSKTFGAPPTLAAAIQWSPQQLAYEQQFYQQQHTVLADDQSEAARLQRVYEQQHRRIAEQRDQLERHPSAPMPASGGRLHICSGKAGSAPTSGDGGHMPR